MTRRLHDLADDVRTHVQRVGVYRVLFVVGLLLGVAVFGASGMVASWLSNPVQQSGSVTYSAADGPSVTFTGDYNFSGTSVFPGSNTVEWRSDAGNITLSSPSPTNATVEQIQGGKTKLSGLDVSGGALTVDAVDRGQTISVAGDTSALHFRTVKPGAGADGTEDIYYAGPSGSTTLTVYGLSGDATYAAVDLGSGEYLDAATANASGAVTFTLPNSQHSVDIRTYNANAPSVSDATPNGSATVEGTPVTLSANVSDADFPNDELTVNFTVNGEVVHTTTVSTDKRVSYSLQSSEVPPAGRHTWGLTVTDTLGQSASDSYEFDLLLPSQLVIRNVTSGDIIQTPNATVEVTFTGDNTVAERTTSDGAVSMKGLPTNEQFTARVDAPGYLERTTVIQSLLTQQTIFLLPENSSAAEIVWSLDDATGRYQGNGAQLIVERPITTNGTTKYRSVAGGDFGATNQVSTFLENGVTYRLKVRNADGDMRVLDTYTVSGPAQETLPIGQVDITIPEDSSPAFNAQLSESNGQRTVRLQYRDPKDSTETFTYEIVRADNESVILQGNTTNVGPFGSYSETVPLPASAPDDVAYEIRYRAERGNQQDAGGRALVGDVPEIAQEWGIDPQVLSLAGYIAILAMTGLVVSWRPSLAPMAGSLTAITLSIFGVVSIPALFLGLGGTTSILIAFAGRTPQ